MCGEVWAKSVYYVILFLCAKLHHVQADAKMQCVSTNLRTAQSLLYNTIGWRFLMLHVFYIFYFHLYSLKRNSSYNELHFPLEYTVAYK